MQRLSYAGIHSERRPDSASAMAYRRQARMARTVGHDVPGEPAHLHAESDRGTMAEDREGAADAAANALVFAATDERRGSSRDLRLHSTPRARRRACARVCSAG